MTTDLNGPSHNQFKKYITDKSKIEIVLVNGEKILGKILWKDNFAVHFSRTDEKEITIPISSILYYENVDK